MGVFSKFFCISFGFFFEEKPLEIFLKAWEEAEEAEGAESSRVVETRTEGGEGNRGVERTEGFIRSEGFIYSSGGEGFFHSSDMFELEEGKIMRCFQICK